MQNPHDEPVALPKLDIVMVGALPCLFGGLLIVGALDILRGQKMTVLANSINAICEQPQHPPMRPWRRLHNWSVRLSISGA
jgi:hypothetical protein